MKISHFILFTFFFIPTKPIPPVFPRLYILKPLKLTSPSSMDAFNLMIDLMNFKSFE